MSFDRKRKLILKFELQRRFPSEIVYTSVVLNDQSLNDFTYENNSNEQIKKNVSDACVPAYLPVRVCVCARGPMFLCTTKK